MSVEEKQLLIAAQEKARRVLSESNARVKRLASDTDAEAVSLLLEQQRVAEALLLTDIDNPAGAASAKEDLAASLNAHRTAAEVLAAAEQQATARTNEIAADAAVEILMAGHREAAAILLDAWMRVTEGRPAGGRS